MAKNVAVWVLVAASACLVTGCGNGGMPTAHETINTDSAGVGLLFQHDFEGGSTNGWVSRGSAVLSSTTEAAADGTHSLKTTGRTASWNGPSLNLLGLLTAGGTYQFSVKVRLAAGQAPANVHLTIQQTVPGVPDAFLRLDSEAVSDAGWVTMTGSFPYTAANVTGLTVYVESDDPTASYYIDTFTVTETAPPPGVNINHTFEDGTLQGWAPRGAVTLTNVGDQAAEGARSLLTTNRTAGFHGPSLNLLGVLRKGATYQVSVRARLATGTPASPIQVTMQRTPASGSTAFEPIAQNPSVTDGAWVTLSGIYSFATDVTGLQLYVESSNATASYYIDSFTLVELAPPAGPPANTDGAAAGFESDTTEGWSSRTGGETVAVTTADAHSGTRSLLTTNRTQFFQGPAFNVTNVMFNGSRYRIAVWVKLEPGQADTQVRLSLQRNLGSTTTFHTVVGNTTVTSGAWVRLAATYDMALANTGLTLYLETNSGAPTSSFYIDDFSIEYVEPPVAERDIPSVFQSHASFFPIGAAVHAGDLTGEHAFLLTKHFNSITSENDMKWQTLQPSPGTFNFAPADAQLAFAKANGMRMRGHTLVWHAQTPAWVFNDAGGAPLTPTPENKALLLSRMEDHIRSVVSHFGSDIYAWDVVNEVIDPSQADGFRRSPWFDVIGPEFIDRAFLVAREVAPSAELYINEFSTTDSVKRQFLYDLVRDLRARGIPVDGVGHQMHNNVDFPSRQAIIDTVNLFHPLGVKQEVTELDVSVYSNSLPGPVADYFDIPESRFVLQGYRYRDFFDAFRTLSGKLDSVTFWGQADDHTWLSSATRADGPLLFDVSLQSKHAYWGVVDPLQLPGADVTTSVVAGSGSALAGQPIPFTITVTNDGDEDAAAYLPADDDLPAANVSLVTAIPSGSVFESLSAPAGWNCVTPAVGGTGTVTCTRSSLDVNASDAFTLNVVPSCSAANGSELVDAANATSSTLDPNLAANNASSATVTVSNPPPVVTLNGADDVTLECGSSYTDAGASAADSCEGELSVTVSGAVDENEVGTYVVTYSAADQAGSVASVARTVNVLDRMSPTLDVVDLIVLIPGAKITLNGTTLTINGQSFPLRQGTLKILGHTIKVSGSTITIDGQAFSVDGRGVMLVLPLHQYQSFGIQDLVAAIGADCDTTLGLDDVVIESVTSDEAEDAPGGRDGSTRDDMVIGSDCRSLKLRAERNASGNGRVYTVNLRVRDASGNATRRSVKIVVPKNQGVGSSVDDGAVYTVNGTCL